MGCASISEKPKHKKYKNKINNYKSNDSNSNLNNLNKKRNPNNNLNNVRSAYILQKIFDIIPKNKHLAIIRYNKKLKITKKIRFKY